MADMTEEDARAARLASLKLDVSDAAISRAAGDVEAITGGCGCSLPVLVSALALMLTKGPTSLRPVWARVAIATHAGHVEDVA